MTKTSGDDTRLEITLPVAATSRIRPERAFSFSMLVSAIRCTLTYVVLPFALPLFGLAPGVGPVLGISIGVIAIAANPLAGEANRPAPDQSNTASGLVATRYRPRPGA